MSINVNDNLKVSIITPSFNSEKTIEKTFISMLNQNYSNIEYILVDGGSTDQTVEIAKKYKNIFPFKFVIISEKDNGIYDAMNKGIRLASGDLIGIVNSDDFYEPEAIKTMVDNYDGTQLKILYGFQRNMDGEREICTFLNHHSQLLNSMITHPTCFVTKEIYNKYGLFNTKYMCSADYEFMLRIFVNDQSVFKPVYKIISNFQIGGASSTQKGARETMRLKLKYGSMNNARFVYEMCKSYLYDICKKLKIK